jgi:hypothetical protein
LQQQIDVQNQTKDFRLDSFSGYFQKVIHSFIHGSKYWTNRKWVTF